MNSIIAYARPYLPFDQGKMQAEVAAIPITWNAHFNTKHYEGSWKVLSLRSPGGRADQIIPEQISNDDFADTPLMAICPSVVELLASIHCPIRSVRLLNLQQGGIIRPHRDHELSFEKGEARLHFPVQTNDDVYFFIEDDLVRMKAGECWYINANLRHAVENKGKTDRIHLVIDCLVNDWMTDLFRNCEKKYVSIEAGKEQMLKVIHELKQQGTSDGLKLAAQLEADL